MMLVSISVMRRAIQSGASRFLGAKLLKPFKASPPIRRYLLSSILPAVLTVKALTQKNKNSIIIEADGLYDANKFSELYDSLVPHRESKEPEFLWRLARALFETCRDMKADDKLRALEDALGIVDEALAIDDNCWAAHKWRAILLDYVWRHKSTKGRIVHSFDVKKHMERAIELNPKDSTSYYLLGEWCFTFADMPWYQRKVASAIFASPPTSTYEEALKYFERAEEISPLFYSMNLLMLGKCLLKLNKQEEAIEFFKKAQSYPVKTADDQQAHAEAMKLLKELRVE